MANKTVLVKNIDDLILMITKKGLSYRQLAEETGVSQTTISLILKGERNPSPETAVNICSVLGCGFEDIFLIKKFTKVNKQMRHGTKK